jgi:hypothetical protein
MSSLASIPLLHGCMGTSGSISCLVTSIQNNLSRSLYFFLSHLFVYFYLLVIKDEFENIKIKYLCALMKLEYQVRRKSGYITNRIYTLGTILHNRRF